jgi:threonine synthase
VERLEWKGNMESKSDSIRCSRPALADQIAEALAMTAALTCSHSEPCIDAICRACVKKAILEAIRQYEADYG